MRISALFRQFTYVVILLMANPAYVGTVNAMDEQDGERRKVERPAMIEPPFEIRANLLRAWTVVYEDFLKTFDLEENDLEIKEYLVSFSEEDDEIVINAGRPPWAPGSLGLEHSVIYRVRKIDYQLVHKVMLK